MLIKKAAANVARLPFVVLGKVFVFTWSGIGNLVLLLTLVTNDFGNYG